jgi:hypothetical protein
MKITDRAPARKDAGFMEHIKSRIANEGKKRTSSF